MNMPKKSPTRASARSYNPLTWFRQLENAIWKLFAEVEYRLRIVPRGTLMKPSKFDQRLLRTVLIVLPLLVGSLFIPRPTRTRVLLLSFLVVVLVVGLIFLLDAREGMTAPPSGARAPVRPNQSPAPPRPGARSVTTSSTASTPRPPVRPNPPSARNPRSP